MDRKSNEPDTWKRLDLVGYQLGLMEASEREQLERLAESRGELEAWCRSVDRLLAPLARDVEAPPPGLDGRIMAAVGQASGVERHIPFRADERLPSAQDVRTRSGALTTMRELAGLAAVLMLFVGVAVPGYRHARMQAMKTACGNNLRMAGAGIGKYAETHGAKQPAGDADGSDRVWVRFDGDGQGVVQNTHIPFRLVQDRFVPPTAFICPQRETDAPFFGEDFAGYRDFPDVRNNSYSHSFAWGGTIFSQDKPLMSDLTPLVDDQRQLRRTPPVKLNSPSHGYLGQNVLGADLGVQFLTSPKLDGGRDDIYRIEGIRDDGYTGRERPERSDTFLIP